MVQLLTKMLGQRKPHDLPLILASVMNDAVLETMPHDQPEIIRHHEGLDFVAGNHSLSAEKVGLVNVMSWETVLHQYVDSVKQSNDFVLLDCRPSLGMLVINALLASDYCLSPFWPTSGGGRHDGAGGYGTEYQATNQFQTVSSPQ